MRPVNLLPDDLAKVRRQVNRPVIAGIAGTSAVAMLLSALYLNASSGVEDNQAMLDVLKQDLAAVPKPKAESPEIAALTSERSARVTALAAIINRRVGWDRLLREISSVLPEDVWLTSMNARSASAAVAAAVPEAAVAGAPASTPTISPDAGFKAEGYTYSHEGVARLLARLQTIPDLTSVNLDSSTLSEVAGEPAVKFVISAQVRPTGATS
jgi:Tfp pilus assembly protein PilN